MRRALATGASIRRRGRAIVSSLAASTLLLGATGLALSSSPGPAGASGTTLVQAVNYNGDRTWNAVNVCYTATYLHVTTSAASSTTFVNGPGSPPDGVGSVRLHSVHGTCESSLRTRSYSHTKLSAITALSYWTYQLPSSPEAQAFPTLTLDVNFGEGGTTADDTLVFDPAYQTKAAGGTACATEGATAHTTWQEWTTRIGCWWDSDGILGHGGLTSVHPLAAFRAVHPNAYVVNHSQAFTSHGHTITPGFTEGGIGVTEGLTTYTTDLQGNVGQVTVGVLGTFVADFEGPPTVTATPTSRPAPSTASLSATGFDLTQGPVSCHFTSGTPASSATLTFGPHTSLVASGTIEVTADDAVGTNPIVCTQTDYDSRVLTATTSFQVTTLSATCTYGTSPPTCVVNQAIGTTVVGSNLTMSEVVNSTPNSTGGVNPTWAHVVLSKVTLGERATVAACQGTHPTSICNTSVFAAADGHLNSVVVDDNRGGLFGWTVTGQMEGTFQGPLVGNDHVIPADFLTWNPSVSAAETSCVTLHAVQVCGPSDQVTEVEPGTPANLSKTSAALLCEAAPGGGGGGTRCTATLSLAVPPYVAAGRYAATIDIVLS